MSTSRTHKNIRRLRELCEPHGGWPSKLEAADELSVFATTTRYPGVDAAVRRDEALRAIDLAQRVRATVAQSLADLGFPLAQVAPAET